MKHQLINERNEPTHAQEKVADVEIICSSDDIANLSKEFSLSFDINMKIGKIIIKKE